MRMTALDEVLELILADCDWTRLAVELKDK
jgi:hypothetical protein